MSWVISLSTESGSFTRDGEAVTSITLDDNMSYLLGLNTLVASSETLTFMDWYLDSSFTEKVTSDTLATADATVYAKWGVLLSFETNNGSCLYDGLYITSKLVSPGETYASLLESDLFETSYFGHTLLGWCTDEDLQVELDTSTVVLTDITLYMHWGLTVTLELDGGTCTNSSGESVTSITVDPGELYLNQLEPYTVTKEGYTLLGWYFKATFLVQITSETVETNSNTHSIYAKWGENVSISFNNNDGDWTGVQPDAITVAVGGTYGELPPTSTASRSHCDNLGWYSSIEDNKKITSDSIVEEGVSELLVGWVVSSTAIQDLTSSLLSSQKILNNLSINYNTLDDINSRITGVEDLVREEGTYDDEGNLLATGTLRVSIEEVSSQLSTAPGDVYSQTEVDNMLKDIEGDS